MAAISLRIDRIETRFDRIERRFDLVTSPIDQLRDSSSGRGPR
jgi:hypothetical protein